MSLKLNSSGGGSVTLQEPSTASNLTLTLPAVTATVLTDSSGVLNIGSGQVYKDASGNVGIGTNSPGNALSIYRGTGVAAFIDLTGHGNTAGTSNVVIGQNSDDGGYFWNRKSSFLSLGTNNTERARIDSSGNMLVGKTSTSFTVEGTLISPTGQIEIAKSADRALNINRLTNDGNLVNFYQDSTLEGNIAVSGTTVSYNAFAGSHWSQLQDGSKPEILRGTVMESIDELCQWPDEPTSERLCRSKISDTAGSKRVYGVFMDWDNDWTATNDMLVTSLGAFVCRINANVTVQMGDLLESNGDGTARVQADDVIRSSTIGKVTSTIKTHEYDDGSYCVPTVLYCG